MNYKNTIAVSLALLLLVAASFFFFRTGGIGIGKKTEETGANKSTITAETKRRMDSFVKAPLKWTSTSGAAAGAVKPALSDINSAEGAGSVNLTDLVASSMFSKMASMDPTSLQSAKATASLSSQNEKTIKDILENSLGASSSAGGIFRVEIAKKDLKISNDNSKEAKLIYLNLMQSIFDKSQITSPKYNKTPEQAANDVNNDCFVGGRISDNKIISGIYENLAGEYLNVPVPSDWADTHIKIISFLKILSLAYDGLADCYNDPIKGYLAINTLSSMGSQIKDISNLLYKEGKEVGFEINL